MFTLHARWHVIEGRLSKAPPVVRPLPAPRPPPDSAAAKASADLVLKAALIRLERHHKAMDRAMGLESAARTVHSEPAVENPAPPSRVSPATNAKEPMLAKPAQTPGAPSIQGPKKKTAADADEKEDAFPTLRCASLAISALIWRVTERCWLLLAVARSAECACAGPRRRRLSCLRACRRMAKAGGRKS